ncbi:MAG: S1C family serine protease [Myxacorys chilensis ATA2-1-KO14]|jgi:S1-C subfamily serine protease|nr:S1C family serine protease [Myxacorys chilensis ATA2-1-KO14]
MTASDPFHVLSTFSTQLADAVEQAGRSIVSVNARRKLSSSGIYWREGIVVTVDHAIRREEEIAITLPDGRTTTATIAARDARTDLALLSIQAVDLPTAEVVNADQVRVGQIALAIARNADAAISASMGIISSLSGSWRWHRGRRGDTLIRPSLLLYPGFSGGALVSATGQIIGMNTAGPHHMSVTIPAATVDRVVDQLLQQGTIAQGYLGLGMQAVQLPDSMQRSLDLAHSTGVIVVSIEPNAPADQAGILIGDIVVTLNGTALADVSDVHAVLDSQQIGQVLLAQVVRGGALVEVSITVGERSGRNG